MPRKNSIKQLFKSAVNRRVFTRNVAGTVVAACGLPNESLLFAQDKTAEPVKTPASEVPYKMSVMLWTVFTDLPFVRRLEKVVEAGYHNVELVGEYSRWTEDEFRRAQRTGNHFSIAQLG